MSDKERLGYLISYHRNLTMQLATCSEGEKDVLNGHLGNLEVEIEAILFGKK